MSAFIGVDPGSSSGGVAVLFGVSEHVETLNLDGATERDLLDFLEDCALPADTFALIEKVSAMPKQGVSSTFKFGASYGGLRMLLVCLRIPFEAIHPATWQAKMQCRSRGDKRVTKARAQELFPGVKVTHAVADALLLAELARRMKA